MAAYLCAEDGSLHTYQGGPSGGGGSAGESLGKESSLRAALAEQANSARPALPFTAAGALAPGTAAAAMFWEAGGAQQVTGEPEVTFGGDVLHNSNAATAKTRLSSASEDYVAVNKSSLNLVVSNSNDSNVIVGVRILLGNAAPAAIPAAMTLFGRTVTIHEDTAHEKNQSRWWDIPFTPAESVVGTRQFNILFTANNQAAPQNIAVDAVEVWACSKAEWGWEAQLSLLSRTLKIQGGDVPHNSKEPVATQDVQISTLKQLELFHRIASAGAGVGAAAPAREEMTAICTQIISAPPGHLLFQPLRRPAKQLLRLLVSDRASYHEKKDFAILENCREQIQLRETAQLVKPSFTEAQLPLLEHRLKSIVKLAGRRPHIFKAFCVAQPSFLPALAEQACKSFTHEACSPEAARGAALLTEILFVRVQQEQPEEESAAPEQQELPPSMALLFGMLLDDAEAVRFATSSTLSRLLLSGATGDSAEDMELEAEPPAEAHAGQSSAPPMEESGWLSRICDVCQTQIIGQRFHCGRTADAELDDDAGDLNRCKDFDLCEGCHGAGYRCTCGAACRAVQSRAEDEEDEEDDETDSFAPLDGPASVPPAAAPTGQPDAVGPASEPASEDEMLQRCLAMSLGKPSEAPSTKPPPQLAESFLALMTQHLERLRGHDGLGVLPYLQLLHLLATSPRCGYASPRWIRLADAVLAIITGYEEQMGTGDAQVSCLLLQLLCLLLHKEKRPSAAVPPSPPTTVRVLQSELAAHMHAAGFSALLLSTASSLFGHFKEQAGTHPTAATAPGPAQVLNVHERAPSRVLAPFWTAVCDGGDSTASRPFGGEIRRLQLDSVLRLAGRLQAHAGQSSAPPMEESGWLSLLCGVINTPNLAFARKQAKKQLLLVCGSKQRYSEVRDRALSDEELQNVKQLVDSASPAALDLSYQQKVELCGSLRKLHEMAVAQPRNWSRYCRDGEPTLVFLLQVLMRLANAEEQLQLPALQLLAAGLKPPQAAAAPPAAAPAASTFQLEHLLAAVPLQRFVRDFMLQASAAIRQEACGVLHSLWQLATPAEQSQLFAVIREQLSLLPLYGQAAREFLQLVGRILQDEALARPALPFVQQLLRETLNQLLATLKQQNRIMQAHENSAVYQQLGSILELDGHFLETGPLHASNQPEVAPQSVRLDALKAETKFTDSCQIVKFNSCQTIHSGVLRISSQNERPSSIRPSSINIYCNNKPVTDVGELKNKWELWKKATVLFVTREQNDVRFEFAIPIVAQNILIEYASFHSLDAPAEKLQCPRCSRTVTDRHGVCKHCGDNAYQCRHCRNINYEKLDAYLCNECGFCKHCVFSFTLVVKPSYVVERITNETERARLVALIDAELENANKRYSQLGAFKRCIAKMAGGMGDASLTSVDSLVASLPGASQEARSCRVARQISVMAALYGKEAKASFESLQRSIQTLQSLKLELLRYMSTSAAGPQPTDAAQVASATDAAASAGLPVNGRYDCALAFVQQCLALFVELLRGCEASAPAARSGELSRASEPPGAGVLDRAVSDELLEELFAQNIPQRATSKLASQLLCLLCCGNAHASRVLHDLLRQRLDAANGPESSQAIALLCQVALIEDDLWPQRLNLLTRVFLRGLEQLGDPHVLDRVVLPCLRVLVRLLCAGNLQDGEHAAQRSDTVLAWLHAASPAVAAWPASQARSSAAVQLGAALPADSWLCRLLLCESSQAIREEVASLLSQLTAQEKAATLPFVVLDLLVGLLPRACAVSSSASEYFELLRGLMTSTESRLYLAARGLLGTLCALIGEEASRVRLQETSAMQDMQRGFILHSLVEILGSLAEVPTISAKIKREAQLPVLLTALLSVRGLVMQKTRFLQDCASRLLKLLTAEFQSGRDEDRRAFVAACVRSMREHANDNDGRSLIFIFEQLCGIVCPEKPEPDYRLTLNKTATQEEFIRGGMTKNPYSMRESKFLTMRDVKNKICRDLEMGGLIEDDNGMELLVAGQIIKLDLPVALVYEQVWDGEASSPMVVVYRLQGLDGEATEPIVESLDEDSGEEQDPETEFAIAAVIREEGGLEVMMDILHRSTPPQQAGAAAQLAGAAARTNLGSDSRTFQGRAEFCFSSASALCSRRSVIAPLLKLLQYSCKLKQNRARMLHMDAARTLLRLACDALAQEALGKLTERLLLTAESLLEEELGAADARASCEATAMEVDPPADTADTAADGTLLAQLLAGLESPAAQAHGAVVKALCKVLPLATRGVAAHVRALLTFFVPFVDFDAYDRAAESSHSFMLEAFVAVVEARASTAIASALKTACVEHRLVSKAVTYFLSASASAEASSARPALPFVLQLLGALARGHMAVQQLLLTPELMERLHALEGKAIGTGKALGSLAESLLEVLRESEQAAAQVDQLRQATQDSKRKAARDKRQQILDSMGMARRGDGGKNVIVAGSAVAMDELEDESGHICVVCGEGETYRAGEPLGCYCFCKRVPLPAREGRAEFGFSSVTCFKTIHFSCHREASRAERTMKQPKEEWEGATLRNSQTKCNNLFPLWGASVSEEAYAVYVEQWWSNLQHAGRVETSRCRLLAHDMKLLLLRFALEESFSTYSKGGGRESNIKLLPYLTLMGGYLLDARQTANAPQRREHEQALAAWLGGAPGQQLAGPAADGVLYMLVMSLLVQSPEEWRASRVTFLQRAVQYAGAGEARERASLMVPHEQRSPARSQRSPARAPQRASPAVEAEPPAAVLLPPPASASPQVRDSGQSPFEVARPMLLFWSLVDRLQDIFKGERPWQAAQPAAKDAWLEAMRERLRVYDQHVLKELQALCGRVRGEDPRRKRLRSVRTRVVLASGRHGQLGSRCIVLDSQPPTGPYA